MSAHPPTSLAIHGTPSNIASPSEFEEFSSDDAETKTLLSNNTLFIFSASSIPQNSIL